ncbi:hypothetical protein KSF_088230 [Reticulibacter mediterranei]|uniref:TIR domain-containing protein n=1 Tax=Reticulibacter mediterranei TaxID=2778369 RepID=A0A8J3IXU7_9CHLR|nr:toll/interleukin-1 receptor domain-containing protein [Reticulibacter mediterranei]GHO98775.1 hypothetical protein KSF_088230 [Reticulibacter mediterranei]
MANQEHLHILQQAVEIWNKWRKEYSDISPDLTGVDLCDSNLAGINLSNVNLTEARLCRTDLRDSDLRRALLDGTDLSEANLMRAVLSQANISNTNLQSANLFGATLIGTTFQNVNLKDVDLSYSELAFAMFGDVNLSSAKGLESIRHVGSSSIGIDTIYRSSGDIPEVFLRSAGVPDNFISYARSLVKPPIEYYSCFINYSSQDQAFAEKLRQDLQTVGIRCWFAPEDLRIGEKFWHRIDEGIQLYDKLLLIISKHSLSSNWVAKEVEEALFKEKKQKTTILFPIRLDNTVLENPPQRLEPLLQTRHIGNFQHWQDHDAYQQAFTRLMRDLTLSIAQETDKQERTV